MFWNFEYLIVFTSAPGVPPEQNDRYWIQPWKVNEIKAYKNTNPAKADSFWKETLYIKKQKVIKNLGQKNNSSKIAKFFESEIYR